MMIKKIFLSVLVLTIAYASHAQKLIGSWQLTEEKTCFQSDMPESDTEKELTESMGASRNAVARIIIFDKKGSGEEGIFSQGKKKGSNMNSFKYQVVEQELQFLDKKSGMITQRFIIEELTETTLRFHNAQRDCEVKTFVRVK
jgi:hypothetical protein